MTKKSLDHIKKSYKPQIKDVEDLCGLALNSASSGEKINVLSKAFLTSYEENHRQFFNNILIPLLGPNLRDLNQVLIVIRNKKAYIYKDFPLTLDIKSKVDIQKFSAVFKSQILDIKRVRFKDAIFDLDVKDGDKFLWLFRNDWSFGLYFDFSGELIVKELWGILGNCYRKIEYYSLYSFLSNEKNFEQLIIRGWFPFVQILGGEFENLKSNIGEKDGFLTAEEGLINAFTSDRIKSFTNYWWRNSIFNNKKGNIRGWD